MVSYFIGEIGINHNGDLGIAKQLIDAVSATGWNCAKFQKRTPLECVPRHQQDVIRETPWGKIPYIEYRYKVEFEREEYDYIDRYCREKPLDWSASVWDMTSLAFIAGYDVPFIKIPSAMMTNPLLGEAAQTGRKLIVSTGMSTLEEVDKAVTVLEKGRSPYVLMHTNSVYPAPEADLNLRVIPFFKTRYGCEVGYSGHERDLEPTVIAAAMGATVIERHITLDHTMWGSDQAASLEVHAMDMLRKRVLGIDAILGDGVKRVTDRELLIREKLRP